MRSRSILVLAAAMAEVVTLSAAFAQTTGDRAARTAIPVPVLHHIHLNSANPERSLEWYSRYWQAGKTTSYGGFPAFSDEQGFYLLYTKIGRQAPGAFDRLAQRSVPQSAFWTFGSTFKDIQGMRTRIKGLDPKQFALVTLYGGPDGEQSATDSRDLPGGGQLMTTTEMRQQAEQPKSPATPPAGGFGYLVDPDGMLVEIIPGRTDDFKAHTHLFSEQPLCAANWHVEHLGARSGQPTITSSRFTAGSTLVDGKWSPCDLPLGERTYPTYMKQGQLRIPAGTAVIGNLEWLWYPRPCQAGRCGPANDRRLVRSRGQVIDHIGLAYPDLDAVMAHLRTQNVAILEGPYKFGETRAILIEDPDGLAFELIEVKR
jgi:catechol 2,3-dioxygenase-like lactoylglutathione lyase family enzyme